VSNAKNKTFLYFAYGSNMLTRRLQNRTLSAKAVGIGYVEGHRLTFDKVSTDGSGKADIEATGNATDRVYGVLFSIDASEESALVARPVLWTQLCSRCNRLKVLPPGGACQAL